MYISQIAASHFVNSLAQVFAAYRGVHIKWNAKLLL